MTTLSNFYLMNEDLKIYDDVKIVNNVQIINGNLTVEVNIIIFSDDDKTVNLNIKNGDLEAYELSAAPLYILIFL